MAGGVHTFGAWNQPSTGHHWLIQRNGTGMVCDYCAVRGLCRKDYHQPVDDD